MKHPSERTAAWCIILAALFSCLVATAESPGPADGATDSPAFDRSGWPKKLVMAYPSIGSEKDTLARYEQFDRFLSTRLSITIEPVVTDGYIPVFRGFQEKEMDVAYLGPMSYVELHDYCRVEPLVMEMSSEGRAGYHGLIITGRDSGITRIEDAKNRKWAMVDPHSTSGFLIPTLYLVREQKTTPSEFASEVIFTGTHDALIAGVAEGRYDVGATNDIDLGRARREQGIEEGRLVVLWKSELYPGSPFAARLEMPESLRKALRQVMIEVNGRPQILEKIGIAGFAPAEDKAYQPVRDLKAFLE